MGTIKTPRARSLAPIAAMPTTPLVDVMLVIFIIIAPLFHKSVPEDATKVDSSKLDDKPTSVQVAIEANGGLFVDGAKAAPAELNARPAALARRAGPAAEMHPSADRATRYEHVAEVMASAPRSGLTKIALVTEGPPSARSKP